MYSFSICHYGTTEPICNIDALNAHDAYEAWVSMEFGNGTCGFDVDVIDSDGVVVEF